LSDDSLLKDGAFIGGSWRSSEQTLQVINPATGGAIATVSCAGAGETNDAIAAAEDALDGWSALSGKERGSLLTQWGNAIDGATEDIARIMTAECGKPLAEARAEISAGLASVHWFAAEASRIYGDVLPQVSEGRRFLTMRQPVGVVGAITPWNFPMSMITRKVAPALAAGCTIVLKPAELTPLTALAMAELSHRAGIPPGVINVVAGDAPAIGQALMRSEVVRKLGFTGSTAVGKLLMEGSAQTVKKVSLELGGNAPLIVFDDADLQKAAAGALASAFRNAGQTCICTNRVFVQDGVYDEFASILTEKVAQLVVGNGVDEGVTCGPLITPAALEKVQAHVSDAMQKGASATTGGTASTLQRDSHGGYFFEPTVLTGVTRDMRCYKEETFGPIAPLLRFSSESEAIALANDTEYGLAAYIFTNDIGRSWRVLEALQFGMVGVNEVAIVSEAAPFGGVKMSGLGRENSKYGMEEFLELKTVCFGI